MPEPVSASYDGSCLADEQLPPAVAFVGAKQSHRLDHARPAETSIEPFDTTSICGDERFAVLHDLAILLGNRLRERHEIFQLGRVLRPIARVNAQQRAQQIPGIEIRLEQPILRD